MKKENDSSGERITTSNLYFYKISFYPIPMIKQIAYMKFKYIVFILYYFAHLAYPTYCMLVIREQ